MLLSGRSGDEAASSWGTWERVYRSKVKLSPIPQIFSCILSLRSNEAGRIGFQEGGSAHFSPFFVCHVPPSIVRDEAFDSVVKPTLIDYKLAFATVLACLKYVSYVGWVLVYQSHDVVIQCLPQEGGGLKLNHIKGPNAFQ